MATPPPAPTANKVKPMAPPAVPPAPGKGPPPPLPPLAKAGAPGAPGTSLPPAIKAPQPLPPGVKPALGKDGKPLVDAQGRPVYVDAQGNPVQIAEEQHDDHVHPQGFWQQPWVQNVMPFVTSLTIHAAILIFGYLTFRVIDQVANGRKTEDQTIIPDSTLSDNAQPGGVPNVGTGGDPLTEARQDTDANNAKQDGWAQQQGANTVPTAAGSPDEGNGDMSDGPMSKSGGPRGIPGGNSDGDAGGGPLSPFGAPGGGGIGPKGPVFGSGGNAHQIVFVCDATGSMLNKLATVKDEMNKAIAALQPIQSFDIVFYQDKNKVEFKPSMVPATPDTKRQAEQFLEGVIAQGTTDPIPAIELALKQHPQLMYFLTDAADFPDPDGVLNAIQKNNADHYTHINTILFVTDRTEHEKNQDSEAFMKKIATETKGKFRWVEMDAIR